MNKNYVLILGALSDIAKSTAHKFASNGSNLLLAARKTSDLKSAYEDFESRYNVDVNFYEFDVLKLNTHKSFIENLREIPSIVICAIGYMGEQKENEKNIDYRTEVLRTNYEGPINLAKEVRDFYVDCEKDNLKVLDFGCGTGLVGLELVNIFSGKLSFTLDGIDISEAQTIDVDLENTIDFPFIESIAPDPIPDAIEDQEVLSRQFC